MSSDRIPLVLVFTDWYLPGYKAGGPISSISNLVDAFGDRFKFRIVCGDRDYLDTQPYPNVESGKWLSIGKAEVFYLNQDSHKYDAVKRLIRAENPDTVYINGIFSRVFSIFPLRAAKRLKKRTVVAPRGMLAPTALGIKSTKKDLFLSLANGLGLYRKVIFHATNDHEAEHIKMAITGKLNVVEIPNVPKLPLSINQKSKTKGYLKILVVARIAPEKNIEFALECLCKLPTHLQVDVEFIGPVYDQVYFAKCKEMESKIPANVKIVWTGARTPPEIPGYLDRAHLFFLPTLGENFGHAILEAMLSGTPVLISDRTPWRNLEEKALGRDADLKLMEAFTDFIAMLAVMDGDTYSTRYGAVAKRALELVDLPHIGKGYKKLFG
jgi:glycosyltransferase involved in cell wall biosynthesis